MLAQQRNVEVVSNNLANMYTTAFQRRRTEFHDLIYQDLRRVGTTSSDAGTIVPTGVQIGLGVKLAAVYRIHEQGSSGSDRQHARSCDPGQRVLPNPRSPTVPPRIPEMGPFNSMAPGIGGDPRWLPGSKPGITIPSNAIDVTVNNSGQVQVKVEGQTALSSVGQLQIATFLNDAGLEAIGDNLYKETPASGAATTGNPASTGFGSIPQGFLETSNVNAAEEISNLISAQRAYEMNSKVIQTSDEMLGTLTALR